MSDLDQLAISRLLGSTVRPFTAHPFGGFSAVPTVGAMLASRPTHLRPLAPDPERDGAIIDAFRITHEGYSVDRTLADPTLASRFIAKVRKLGVDGAQAAIGRRLLRLRKAGGFPVRTTREDKRDLQPFLIPAELSFAQLSYTFDASYDDLLADPEVGRAFDETAARIGHPGDVVAFRLAALHLRKNVRSRSKIESEELAGLSISQLSPRWQTPGMLADVRLDSLPDEEGVFSLREPSRYLYLSKHPSLRQGVAIFQHGKILSSVANRFWTPSPSDISVAFVRPENIRGVSLRLFELKALETYQPLLNMLPKTSEDGPTNRRSKHA